MPVSRTLSRPLSRPLSRAISELLGGFNPLTLFSNGEAGAWYDPSDLSTLYQDAAGTTPVTADGDPVGYVEDKSGNSTHSTQSTASAKTTYKTGASLGDVIRFAGGDYYDSTLDASHNTNGISGYMKVTPTSITNNSVLVHFSDGTESNAVYIIRDTNNRVRLLGVSSGSIVVDLYADTPIVDEENSIIGFRIGSGTYTISVNNLIKSRSATVPSGLNSRRIGADQQADSTATMTWSDASSWEWSDTTTTEINDTAQLSYVGDISEYVDVADEVPDSYIEDHFTL